ncbi:MAG: hypothetical protein R3C28_26735 [Pirellulaceae bacterium]
MSDFSSNFPETIDFSILSADQAAAHVFTAYRPILEGLVARRLGRHREDQDVQDKLQDFFAAKFVPDREGGQTSFVEKWDPERGRFRWFLLRSFDNFIKRSIKTRAIQWDPEKFDIAANQDIDLADQDVSWVYSAFELAIARFEDYANEKYRHVLMRYDVEPWINEKAVVPTYDQLSADLKLSNTQITGILRSARKMFQKHLFDVISETHSDQTEQEIQSDFCLAMAAIKSPNFASERRRETERADIVDFTLLGTIAPSTNISAHDGRLLSGMPLERLLSQPLASLSIDAERLIAKAAANVSAGTTLRHVLLAFSRQGDDTRRPSLETLKSLKDAFKTTQHLLEPSEWKVVYCAFTSAAVLGFGTRAIGEFTRNSPEQILENTKRIRDKYFDIMPRDLDVLFRESIESLENQ